MADWFQDLMNLDLNLGPVGPTTPAVGPETEPSLGESVDVEDPWGPPIHVTFREAIRQRTRQRLRWRHLQLSLEDRSLRLAVDSHDIGNDPGDGGSVGGAGEDGSGTSHVGEGSAAHEERSCEVLKKYENHLTSLESDSVEEKEDVGKDNTEVGSFFDCNICLDMSREPVVTCCGHLFCWSCIYRWLHIHSDAKECPVCKGEVTLKSVIPIYGRGTHTHEPEEDSDIKIPARPSARRVEGLRQTIQRTASLFPMEEMIRRLGARFELTHDFFQLPGAEGDSEPNSRASLLNRIMTTRARHREQQASVGTPEDSILNRMMNLQREQSSAVPPPEDVVDLTRDGPEPGVMPRRLPPLTYRRGQSHRSGTGVRPSDRFLEIYLGRSPPVISREIEPSLVDDRDSFSSIAAVIHGESQTVDTAVEIDSLVSLSTSSSRRRHDTSRSSDMDSGDSRALRRRRLN